MSQNAFLTETNPATGRKWDDRYGIAYGKGFKKVGNVERFLSYSKLHRTGRLLRGLKVRRTVSGRSIAIELYNNVPYASDHELGNSVSKARTVKPPYATGGAKGVILGGGVVSRPFMRPSRKLLNQPKKMINDKIREFGWLKR